MQPHGLLGQSWRRRTDEVHGREVADVEGRVDEYGDAHHDLLGYDNAHTRFKPKA